MILTDMRCYLISDVAAGEHEYSLLEVFLYHKLRLRHELRIVKTKMKGANVTSWQEIF